MDHCFNLLKEGLAISIKDWKDEDIAYAKELSLLFCFYPDAKNWIKKHRKNVKLFIQLKSAITELPWIRHLQRFDAFWKMVN